jgi:hypothetical protein
VNIDWPDVIRAAISIVAGVSIGISYVMARRWQRLAVAAMEQTEVALDQLAQMEVAHDPGRGVQNRLAAAFEAGLVRTGGDPEPQVATRRAAAQAMAAQFIETCRRANLRIVTEDD